MIFGWLRNRRRARLLRSPFPSNWDSVVRRNVAMSNRMPAAPRSRLIENSRIFAGEKDFEGCAGQVVDDEIRVTIAAQACLLTVGLDVDLFHRVKTILVYPTGYRAPSQREGTRENVHEARLGEAWYGGPVILAWDAVLLGGRNPGRGRNVVVHEFAHQLDFLDGIVDGTPPIADNEKFTHWREVMTREYCQLNDDTEAGRPTLLDEYGTTNPGEFFAVSTECFYSRASAMKARHPNLFGILADFYRVDPSEWDAP